MDRQTDRPTDGRTDKAGCRVACTRLKRKKIEKKKKEKSVVLVWDFAKWCWGVVIEMTKLRACVCEYDMAGGGFRQFGVAP